MKGTNDSDQILVLQNVIQTNVLSSRMLDRCSENQCRLKVLLDRPDQLQRARRQSARFERLAMLRERDVLVNSITEVLDSVLSSLENDGGFVIRHPSLWLGVDSDKVECVPHGLDYSKERKGQRRWNGQLCREGMRSEK